MNFFNNLILKINFKKLIVFYAFSALIASIACTSYLCYVFRDKISFAYAYNTISERIEKDEASTKELKDELTTFVQKNPTILDVLILDNKNNVTFSAQNSEFATKGTFTLMPDKAEKSKAFILKENPNLSFSLVNIETIALSDISQDYEHLMQREHNDEIFFQQNSQDKFRYFLSYISCQNTGERIYFIKSNELIHGDTLSLKITAAIATFFFMLYWVIVAIWVYANANKAKLNAVLWGIIVLFTNLAGVFVFLIYKQSGVSCRSCGLMQNKNNQYCTTCGDKLYDTCIHCNATVNKNDYFCSQCGNKTNK
ncbi:zinc ribbon domain-containing protein [Clostridium grantii]|uniref:DZANK-type domain-containing protein n=1 Tax=Clostridium grantii DSM 8605 TaxID=1121316 RepID=A0A1M5WXQ3_9CLOT|nr:zinc ribbon domain-containing protein [Clostridium grantii]SHH92280.1 hypothetical protein SAMN02745207_03198 [Clostridium grantii DSM 8605]